MFFWSWSEYFKILFSGKFHWFTCVEYISYYGNASAPTGVHINLLGVAGTITLEEVNKPFIVSTGLDLNATKVHYKEIVVSECRRLSNEITIKYKL